MTVDRAELVKQMESVASNLSLSDETEDLGELICQWVESVEALPIAESDDLASIDVGKSIKERLVSAVQAAKGFNPQRFSQTTTA